MKKRPDWKKIIGQITKSRAAAAVAASATAFLCVFTLLEFFALQLEVEIPALRVLSGGSEQFWMEEYRAEEMAFDESTENELLDAEKEKKKDTGQRKNVPQDVKPQNSTEEPAVDIDSGQGDVSGQNKNADNVKSQEYPYFIKINRKENCITIYTTDVDGTYTVPYKAMICSTGLYNATPRGTYHLSDKYLWRELYGGVYGQYATRITGGILFHSVPYYRKSKASLCTDKYNKLGQQASMGCVRLTVEDAKWIAENCPSGTAVEIYDDDDPGPLGKPEAAKIDPDSPNKSWDPTDPDEENPWHEFGE